MDRSGAISSFVTLAASAVIVGRGTSTASTVDGLIYAMDTRGGHLGTWRVDGAQNVDRESVDLGDRKQGEGVSYSRDGRSLFASSEKRNSPLYVITRPE